MKKTGILSKSIVLVLIFCMVAGNAVSVEAKSRSSSKNSAYRAVFDAEYYYNTYSDLQAAIGMDEAALFQHFVTFGIVEGRSGCADFNITYYMSAYPDLQAAFGTDRAAYCRHYADYGKAEGRVATGTVVTTTAKADPVAATNVIGNYVTVFDPAAARAINITVAASRINGVTLKSGDKFSFNTTVLPRTEENGYVKAPVIENKRYVLGTGGGICQVSSTLYAAMVSAGIPATERYPHSLPASYIPAGLDATISGNTKDLKFTNTKDYTIQILASVDNTAGTVTVSIVKQ